MWEDKAWNYIKRRENCENNFWANYSLFWKVKNIIWFLNVQSRIAVRILKEKKVDSIAGKYHINSWAR